jgi:hypothetical protein
MQHRCTDGSVSSDGRLLVSLPLVWRARICVLALCSLLFLFSPPRAVADFSGPVVSVLDGDTIEVLHNTHAERIRLNGIDCQEEGSGVRLSSQAGDGHDGFWERSYAPTSWPSRQAYFLALARLRSACVALSGTRILGVK